MSSEQFSITPEDRFIDRRTIIRGMGLGMAGLSTLGVTHFLHGISGSWMPQDGSRSAIEPAIGELCKDAFPGERSTRFDIAPRTHSREDLLGLQQLLRVHHAEESGLADGPQLQGRSVED